MLHANMEKIVHKPISDLGIDISDVDAVISFNGVTYFIKVITK